MVAPRDRPLYRHPPPPSHSRPLRIHDLPGAARQCRRSQHGALQSHSRMARAGRLVRIQATGGFGAVVLWKALLLAALCGLTGRVAWRRTGSALWGVARRSALLRWRSVRADRPSILSYVFTALFIAIFEDAGVCGSAALALVWANCHGGFFLGWVVCGAYRSKRRTSRARPSPSHPHRRLHGAGIRHQSQRVRRDRDRSAYPRARYRRPSSNGPTPTSGARRTPSTCSCISAAICLALSGSASASPIGFVRRFGAAALMAFRNELLIGVSRRSSSRLISRYGCAFPGSSMPRSRAS